MKTKDARKEQIIRIMINACERVQNRHYNYTAKERKLYSILQEKLNNFNY